MIPRRRHHRCGSCGVVAQWAVGCADLRTRRTRLAWHVRRRGDAWTAAAPLLRAPALPPRPRELHSAARATLPPVFGASKTLQRCHRRFGPIATSSVAQEKDLGQGMEGGDALGTSWAREAAAAVADSTPPDHHCLQRRVGGGPRCGRRTSERGDSASAASSGKIASGEGSMPSQIARTEESILERLLDSFFTFILLFLATQLVLHGRLLELLSRYLVKYLCS
jgi:hypothetical protein